MSSGVLSCICNIMHPPVVESIHPVIFNSVFSYALIFLWIDGSLLFALLGSLPHIINSWFYIKPLVGLILFSLYSSEISHVLQNVNVWHSVLRDVHHLIKMLFGYMLINCYYCTWALHVADLSIVQDERTVLNPHGVMHALSFYVSHFNLTRQQV